MLNILPAKKKIQISKAQLYSQVRSLCISSIIFSVLLSSVFIGTRIVVATYKHQLETEQNNITINSEDEALADAKFEQLTTVLSSVEDLYENNIHPLATLPSILNAIPENVSLQRISYNYTDNSINVTGNASNRDSLLEIQNSINDLPELSEVKFQVKSLTKKVNIPFDFSAQFNYAEEK